MISRYYLLRKLWVSLRYSMILLTLGVTLFPIYWFAMISLKTQREAFRTPPDWIFRPTIVHYQRLFSGQVRFLDYFSNSIVIAFVSTAIALFVGAAAAYSLSRARFRGRNTVLLTVLTSRMLPPMLFVIPYYLFFARHGLLDTRLGLIVVFLQFNLTLAIWSMRAFFDDIPLELEQAAYIDGASDFQTFWRIVLPLSAPGLAATAVLCLIMSWNNFVYALLLTRSRSITAPVAVVMFASHEAAEWGMVAAGALVLTMPVIFFVFLVRKYLVIGLLGGAIKE